MSESKVTASHLRRTAAIYVRQSSLAQVECNRESTARQYDLVSRAETLGWPRGAVSVIDEDLGVSGASTAGRSGFAELVTKVGPGQVGIVLALEVSRLARNNADWYRLLDLAGITDTLIADADGVYQPGLFNDRMLLGMKGTMSEAELPRRRRDRRPQTSPWRERAIESVHAPGALCAESVIDVAENWVYAHRST
jgi:DNA invertase Pin-like site-specific DNA recombinase